MDKRFLWTALFLFFATLIAACSAVQSDPIISSSDDEAASPIDAPEPTPTEKVVAVNLENLGPAPEIENEVWLNTDQPLPLASQEGKVVLLEFWTFG